MAMSENAKKVINYLKENNGKHVTSGDVAEAVGIEKRTVDGVFTGIQKKGLGARVDGTVTGTKEISFLSITDAGKACDATELSDNAGKILAYLTGAEGENVTLDDVAEAIDTDKRVVNGAFNGLVKKGYCVRTAATIEAPVAVKFLTLTDAGMTVDVDAEDAE
jgi:DNA-binding MarR family transcriptional regulator